MKFVVLQARVIRTVNLRIRNGEITERGLARLAGISQPHMHNVLKGVRQLSTELADQILGSLGMSITDLLEAEEWDALARRFSLAPCAGASPNRAAWCPHRQGPPA